MRKLITLLVATVLLPVGVAAQETGSGEHKRPNPTVTEQQARNAAVARVRGDLAAGKLNAWAGAPAAGSGRRM